MATPGKHKEIRGIEVIAAPYEENNSSGCRACHFAPEKNATRSCADVGCFEVIWLTPLDYIAHRLAGETT